MQDIRSFFKIDNKKRKPSNEPENSAPNKKIALVTSEDDESSITSKKRQKKRIIEDSSDEEIAKTKIQKRSQSPPKKKKEIEVKDLKNLFGGPVKRTDRPKETKSSPKEQQNQEVIDFESPKKSKSNGKQNEDSKDKIEKESLKEKPAKSPKKDSVKSQEKKTDKSPVKKQDEKLSKKDSVESPKKSHSQKSKVDKESPKKQAVENKKKESPKKAVSPVKARTEKSSKIDETKSPAKDGIKKNSPVKKEAKQEINGEWMVTKKPEVQPSTSKANVDKPKHIPVKPMTPIKRDIQPIDVNTLSFVDKYKPNTVKEIIGQQGAGSNANKLQNWLLHWHKNHGDPKKKAPKFNPYAKNDDGSSFKAALLSGMPGIGKTTTAHLVCKELLFDAVEFNASDTRSKRLLKEEVQQLLTNQSLKGYASGEDKGTSKRHVLIMDEVDGMAGNEDRGGVAELIQLIKESQIPVICMCNDRNNPKMRSLANYCYDLRFQKPSINQIRSAMMSICFKEGIKLEPGAIDSIIGGTGNDVRQTLNHLALYSASKEKKIGAENAKKTAQLSEKDVKIVSKENYYLI